MFRSNKFSGIDFRDNKITFANIKLEKDEPIVLEVKAATVERKLLEGGRLINHEHIDLKLKQLLTDKDVSKLVHIAIPTQYTIVRKINTLPDVGEVELSRLLQFQVGESIHLPFDEPIYDFVKIGSIHPQKVESKEDEEVSLDELTGAAEAELKGSKSEILFFATSKTLAEDLSKACLMAGFKPRSAEIRGLALQRLLLHTHPSWVTTTEMIVDISEDSVDLHIFKDELIIFTRTMPINRSQYNSVLIMPLDEQTMVVETDDNHPLILKEMDEVEHFAEVAVSIVNEPKSEPPITPLKERFDEESYISDLINEIEKAQNFFRYSLGERDSEFKRIIVTGECTEMVFLPLAERMNTEVCRINYSPIIAPTFTDKKLLDTCSVAIGLAIRANEKVDKKWK